MSPVRRRRRRRNQQRMGILGISVESGKFSILN